MMAIHIEERLDVGVDVAERFHQIRERSVARGGGELGARDGVVEGDWFVAQRRKVVEDRALRIGLQLHQDVRGDERPRIDEWIARDAVLELELHERVERIAGWLDLHAMETQLGAREDHREHDHFRNTLDRNRNVGISYVERLAVDGLQADPELAWVDAG